MSRSKYLIACVGMLSLLLMVVGLAQEAQAPPAGNGLADVQRHLTEATTQVFDRDVELVHVRTELANCHASNDSLELSRQVTDLVRRCETLFAVKCKWDDAQRRVVKDVSPSQEPQP